MGFWSYEKNLLSAAVKFVSFSAGVNERKAFVTPSPLIQKARSAAAQPLSVEGVAAFTLISFIHFLFSCCRFYFPSDLINHFPRPKSSTWLVEKSSINKKILSQFPILLLSEEESEAHCAVRKMGKEFENAKEIRIFHFSFFFLPIWLLKEQYNCMQMWMVEGFFVKFSSSFIHYLQSLTTGYNLNVNGEGMDDDS